MILETESRRCATRRTSRRPWGGAARTTTRTGTSRRSPRWPPRRKRPSAATRTPTRTRARSPFSSPRIVVAHSRPPRRRRHRRREREKARSPRPAPPRPAPPRPASPRPARLAPAVSLDGTRRLEAVNGDAGDGGAGSARREARAKPAWGGGRGGDAAGRARRENRSPFDAARGPAPRASPPPPPRRRPRRWSASAPRARRPSTPRRRPGRWAPPGRSSPALARPAALSNRVEDRLHRDSVRPGAPRGDAIRGDPRRGHAIRAQRRHENFPARVARFPRPNSATLSSTPGTGCPPRHAGHRGAARAFVRGWTGPAFASPA